MTLNGLYSTIVEIIEQNFIKPQTSVAYHKEHKGFSPSSQEGPFTKEYLSRLLWFSLLLFFLRLGKEIRKESNSIEKKNESLSKFPK